MAVDLLGAVHYRRRRLRPHPDYARDTEHRHTQTESRQTQQRKRHQRLYNRKRPARYPSIIQTQDSHAPPVHPDVHGAYRIVHEFLPQFRLLLTLRYLLRIPDRF